MKMSFSEIPDDAVREQMTKALYILGDLERIYINSGAGEDVVSICRATLDLLGAIRSISDEDKADAKLRIKSAIEQLQGITLQD